jgi:protein-L-isoaspartate(D-aspartate) O-methyltransferase
MGTAFSKIIIPLLIGPLFYVCHGGCAVNWFQPSRKELPDSPAAGTARFAKRREQMVREQLQARGISDTRVLAAMRDVPRHEFVPAELVESAYEDNALPIRLGQTISQPYIVAYMTQALELRGTERVLEIGTGSGYQAAVLATIVPEVYTVEILPELKEQASVVLSKLGYSNIHFRVGDGSMGWPEHAPFDRIIVTAAPEKVPQPLIDQLKVGGRLVIPVGTFNQDLLVLEKKESGITTHSTIPVRFVPMTVKPAASSQ